jgi:Na+-transporting NADH:ubiquinone oxidoreductase subunit D
LFDNNPIALQVLGICSALAVTTKMETGAGDVRLGDASRLLEPVDQRCSATTFRPSIRIIVQLTIIASLVIVADQMLKAYLLRHQPAAVGVRRPDHHQLHHHGPRRGVSPCRTRPAQLRRRLGNGIGYGLILVARRLHPRAARLGQAASA